LGAANAKIISGKQAEVRHNPLPPSSES
jgi:hypothetical protein